MYSEARTFLPCTCFLGKLVRGYKEESRLLLIFSNLEYPNSYGKIISKELI